MPTFWTDVGTLPVLREVGHYDFEVAIKSLLRWPRATVLVLSEHNADYLMM